MPIELLALVRGKKVMVGAIDVATDIIESPKWLIPYVVHSSMLMSISSPCTNCGMAPLSREVARGKLNALRAGADIVRQEISG